jgi:hypothetical protein
MQHSYPDHSYPLSDYDDHLCLKPPVLLWVAVLYLSRACTLPFAMAISHFAGVDASAITMLRSFWSLDALLPSLIAAVMLYAMVRRVPGAHRGVRWIWAHGRLVLAAAAVLDMALLAFGIFRQGEINDESFLSCLAGAFDVYFLVYIVTSKRVGHTFSEFPPPLAPALPVTTDP